MASCRPAGTSLLLPVLFFALACAPPAPGETPGTCCHHASMRICPKGSFARSWRRSPMRLLGGSGSQQWDLEVEQVATGQNAAGQDWSQDHDPAVRTAQRRSELEAMKREALRQQVHPRHRARLVAARHAGAELCEIAPSADAGAFQVSVGAGSGRPSGGVDPVFGNISLDPGQRVVAWDEATALEVVSRQRPRLCSTRARTHARCADRGGRAGRRPPARDGGCGVVQLGGRAGTHPLRRPCAPPAPPLRLPCASLAPPLRPLCTSRAPPLRPPLAPPLAPPTCAPAPEEARRCDAHSTGQEREAQ
jgi:hypothetical protein